MDSKILERYYEAGLSLLPVNGIKEPTISSWEERKKTAVKPNGDFSGQTVMGVAVICGRVSGGLEIIDFDTKNDLSGTLMSDFKSLLDDEPLIKKLVIQRTPSGGFHFIYKCEEIEGNKKLARRERTDEEKKKNPKQRVTAIIETRGEGGYFLVEPSEGYKIIHGSLLSIPVISIDEREQLHECAKAFNTYITKAIDYKQKEFTKGDGSSPFEQFNQNFDVIGLLEQEGWQVVRQQSDKLQLRRPGKDRGFSGTYFLNSRVFFPFTSSSEFEPEKGYNPVAVYTTLRCNGDYSRASKEIREMGYGTPQIAPKIIQPSPTIKPVSSDDIWSWDGVEEYMQKVQDGTFETGLSTGMKRFDDHFRFKRGNLNVVNGHDNVGKTIILIFLMLITAKRYDWKWVVYLAENTKKNFMRKAVEFLKGEPIRGMETKTRQIYQQWIMEHFFLIDSTVFCSYDEMLNHVEYQRSKRKIDGVLFDPYNSLKPKYQSESAKINMHQFDYEVMNTFRSYTKANDVSIYLNCHAVTSALRKTDPDGYLVAPNRADTEGGLKFASKADDFLTIHRKTNHPTEWMITDVHVRKIREQETGGMPTPKDQPLKLQMMFGGVGFVDEYGWNPVIEKRFDPIRITNQQGNTELHVPDTELKDWTEPIKEELPF